jgi:hypothetical protein
MRLGQRMQRIAVGDGNGRPYRRLKLEFVHVAESSHVEAWPGGLRRRVTPGMVVLEVSNSMES